MIRNKLLHKSHKYISELFVVSLLPKVCEIHTIRLNKIDIYKLFLKYNLTHEHHIFPACSKTLIAHKSTKEFRFPKHSSRYPNNANCTWIIVNYHHDSKLALRFVHFDVENGYDFVTVYADGVLQERLTGNATNGTTFWARRNMRIVFTSDNIVNKTGFRAIYRASM